MEVVTQSKPSPTVILAHPSDGLNWNRYVVFWGSLLKSWGCNVVLPDSFTTRGFRNKEVMYRAGLVNYDQRAEDMVKVAEWINKQKWHSGKIGIIGFSHGGSAVVRTANVTSLISVGVAYYPGCFTDDKTTNPKFPVQIHIGSDDAWTTSSRCVRLAEKNSIYDLYVYEGATHAFDIPASTRVAAGYTLSYDPIATKAAEDRTRLFLKKYLD
jgi:dienelactone hydrolase